MEIKLSEEEIRAAYEASVLLYGKDQTHDFECCTWRGQNWDGACDCSLSPVSTSSERR